MTDTTTAAPADPAASSVAVAETKVFELAVPIADDEGKSYDTLTLIEPERRHKKAADATGGSRGAQRAAYIAALASVPVSAIRRMKLRDLMPIADWINEIEGRGVEADVAAELPDVQALVRADLKLAPDAPFPDTLPDGYEIPRLPLVAQRVFDLAVPVQTNTTPVLSLTVREPDLEAGIAAEKFKSPDEQTDALIAMCASVSIPIVSRLKMRDYNRIDRYLSFFFPAGKGSSAT